VGEVVERSDHFFLYCYYIVCTMYARSFLGTGEELDWGWENVLLRSGWVDVGDEGMLQGQVGHDYS